MSNCKSGLQPNTRIFLKNFKSGVLFIHLFLLLFCKNRHLYFKTAFMTSFEASFLLNDNNSNCIYLFMES